MNEQVRQQRSTEHAAANAARAQARTSIVLLTINDIRRHETLTKAGADVLDMAAEDLREVQAYLAYISTVLARIEP